MRRAWLTIFSALLCLPGYAFAADLEKIDRVIGKLPSFSSEPQHYCLLVFGPQARKRVWLVCDGNVLYVDRNSNGDLAEPGERVVADPKASNPEEAILDFRVGDIVDDHAVHKDLRVSWFKLDHLRDTDSDVRAALDRDAKFRGCRVSIDMAIPNQKGAGIDGRVPQSAGTSDYSGLLQFGTKPAEAPIIHFGGPWEVTLAGRAGRWYVDRSDELYLVVGTPGVGPGTTAKVAYDRVIPPGIVAKLQVSFPPASPGHSPVVTSYELTKRCCEVNLYGDVSVPANIGTGKASVRISLDGWPGVVVMPTTHEFEIAPPKPGPKLEPVSPRLVSKLEHEHPGTSISGIQFSHDGRRLIAGDYPGGIIHVWDVASGKRLATMDAGAELRASANYFMPSPDWQTVFAWQEGRGTFEKRERDGKTFHSVKYHSIIRSWKLDSGNPLRTYQAAPPHGIRMMYLAPNGKYFLTLDEIPGEFESQRPRALTLWDTVTGQYRQVERGNADPGPISADSRYVAVSIPLADDGTYDESIKIYAAPEWEEKCSIPFDSKFTDANPAAFAAGGRILVALVRVYEKKNDWQNNRGFLKFWDANTGKEILSIPASEKNQGFAYIKVSPDGETVVATTWARLHGKEERLIIVDVPRNTWKAVDVAPNVVLGEPLIHPNGKWLAVPTQVVPSAQLRDANPDELQQPRIVIVGLANGEILETLVAPQVSILSSAFSPDGTTMATSGKGEVLLWDFHTPPGRDLAKTLQWRDRKIELAGPLTDGGTLDWRAYQGHVVVVDFWATTCEPCVADMPDLTALYERFHDRGLRVIGISLDDDIAGLKQFVKDQRIPWAIVYNPAAASGGRHPMALKYGVDSIPAIFLVDRNGKVVRFNSRVSQLTHDVESLLDQPIPAGDGSNSK